MITRERHEAGIRRLNELFGYDEAAVNEWRPLINARFPNQCGHAPKSARSRAKKRKSA